MNPGQIRGELKNEIGDIRGCECRLSLDIFNDYVGRGENLAGLIEVIRHRRGHSYRVQELQELEFVNCYMRVVLEVPFTMLA